MRKLRAFLLGLVLAFGCAGPAFAAQNPTIILPGPATGAFALYSHPAADCATGAGTTCNVVFALQYAYTSTTSYTCRPTISGGTAAAGMIATVYANSNIQATVYVTASTGQSYAVSLECNGF